MRAGGHVFADLERQPEKSRDVGDRRAILADGVGDLLLREMEFVRESAVGVRFLHRVEIFALEVFDERGGEQPIVRDVADDDRHLEKAGALRRAPAAFAGDDLVASLQPCARRSAE